MEYFLLCPAPHPLPKSTTRWCDEDKYLSCDSAPSISSPSVILTVLGMTWKPHRSTHSPQIWVDDEQHLVEVKIASLSAQLPPHSWPLHWLTKTFPWVPQLVSQHLDANFYLADQGSCKISPLLGGSSLKGEIVAKMCTRVSRSHCCDPLFC